MPLINPRHGIEVIKEKPSQENFTYQTDFTEHYIEPDREQAVQYQDEIEQEPQAYDIYDTYENEPYDDWLELIEDYLDDIEDIEDDIALLELQELNGLGTAQLGAFWHKRKKRLELKRKRQDKRLKKAEKKGKNKRVEQLKLKLQKNKMKLEDTGKWRKVRKQWRKENKRGFWQGIQRTGQGAIDALVKFNPISIAARNGFLAALKLNVKKISSRLKWGYATKEQALKHGMSIERWQKSKQALAKVEKLFVKKTKGSKKALKNAIIKGGKGLNGASLDGLGVAHFSAVALVATPIIIAVVKILQDTGIMNLGVKAKHIEEDLKRGNYENNSDVQPSQYDDVELEIEQSWYQKKGVKIAGVVGGGLLLAGLGYAAFSKKKKQLPTHKNEINGSLSGKGETKTSKQKVPNRSKTKEEPIKEITLT